MTRSEEKMTNPLLDSQMINDLCDPFHPSLVEWKPQAVSKDGKRALAVPYIDSRHYQQRLDQVSPGWHSAYEFIKARRLAGAVQAHHRRGNAGRGGRIGCQ
jgi:hypothetical protein